MQVFLYLMVWWENIIGFIDFVSILFYAVNCVLLLYLNWIRDKKWAGTLSIKKLATGHFKSLHFIKGTSEIPDILAKVSFLKLWQDDHFLLWGFFKFIATKVGLFSCDKFEETPNRKWSTCQSF